MTASESVATHYSVGDIVGLIKSGLEKTGKSTESVTVDDLSLVDEFHIGGRIASEHFFDGLGFSSEDHLLDVGCGIGGAARYVADRTGSRVTGIDLTDEYIQAGAVMNRWVGLEENVRLGVGIATSLDLPDESFDGAYTMHVFMNVEDKLSGFKEVFRVLKPGTVFGVYDIMKYGDGDIAYPVPWAPDERNSFLVSPDNYVKELESAGFEIEFVNDRHEFAVDTFEDFRAEMAGSEGPPPLGTHILMGKNAPIKVKNLTENLINRLAAPFEIKARKRL